MSSRRLVQRSRHDEASTPQRSRGRGSEAVGPPALPPYEPPCCPLSEVAKNKLDELPITHDYEKYKKHIRAAISSITNTTEACNDRLWLRKNRLAAEQAKVRERNVTDPEKLDQLARSEEYARVIERQVNDVTAKAEQALRELIDFGDELSMQPNFIHEVSQKVHATDRAVHPRQRRQPTDSDNDEQQSGLDRNEKSDEQAGLSVIQVLQSVKEEYTIQYGKKSMRDRYANHNDYKSFKLIVHEVQNQGPNAPPLANPRHWFPDEKSDHAGKSYNLQKGDASDKTSNSEDDDDIVMTGATQSLTCPLTLQYLRDPYSNDDCKHTLEKEAMIEYFGRGIKDCPQGGCEAKGLRSTDYHPNERIRRLVQRAQRLEAQKAAGDDFDDDTRSRVPDGAHDGPLDADDDHDEYRRP